MSGFREIKLPSYKCRKVVEGSKIKEIKHNYFNNFFNNFKLELNNYYNPDSTLSVPISIEYIHKFNPKVGGYYVKDKDGYESFSPAEAFEEGYILIEENEKEVASRDLTDIRSSLWIDTYSNSRTSDNLSCEDSLKRADKILAEYDKRFIDSRIDTFFNFYKTSPETGKELRLKEDPENDGKGNMIFKLVTKDSSETYQATIKFEEI